MLHKSRETTITSSLERKKKRKLLRLTKLKEFPRYYNQDIYKVAPTILLTCTFWNHCILVLVNLN